MASRTSPRVFTIIVTLIFAAACKNVIDRRDDLRPRVLRDVPAQNLAYRLSPDSSAPTDVDADDPTEKLEIITAEFATKRTDDALLRTVKSPDGKRVLALYSPGDEPGSSFRIDIYNAEGQFIRNMIPPDLSCVFPQTVSWSPDGNYINFIAHKRATPIPSPTPLTELIPEPETSPLPAPSVAPAFDPVASYSTEQIYVSDRDGYGLKPFTAREGLIYFYFAWAPDGHAMVALACKEDEWTERERQFRAPAGRPRLITPDGTERLLDDNLTDALPVWSPDASKVATAFDTEVAIYDSSPNKPTQARVRLNDQLLTASVAYEQAIAAKKASPSPAGSGTASPSPSPAPATSSTPASFNPIVRLEWTSPERLYFQTAYVRIMPAEVIKTFPRWHLLNLSAQAAVLK
ncbi:MAG TPA: hypothetical protein VFS77_00325 [Pyrinomonadaceae bacterium]|nr:hypothetical protein [Pyrinomonadaceae bacterium]